MKILIGYEGTPASDASLPDLGKAGLPADAQACVLVGIPLVPPSEVLARDPAGDAWLPAYAAVGAEKQRVDAALALGRKAADSLLSRFPAWEIKVEARFEPPAQSILEFEDEWKPDLIAVGSHGWSWMGRTFLGSTAEKVMAHAKADVRLCHPRTGVPDAPPRILAAVDGSRDSRHAVDMIAKRFWPVGTRIRLVAANETFAWVQAMAKAEAGAYGEEAIGPGRWPWMERHLADQTDRLKAIGLEAEAAILPGEPRHVLLSEAESFRADCIFLGRRGVTGFKRLLLGSVSGAIASHAPCTVEIIRNPEGA